MRKRLEAIGVGVLKGLGMAVIVGYYLAGAVIVGLVILWMLHQGAGMTPYGY